MSLAEVSPSIRAVRPGEAELLSRLALRSKAQWGYPPDFIEDCREELTLAPEFIEARPVYVAESGGRVEGFYSLLPAGTDVELLHLFVEPDVIGAGRGRLLWRHAVNTARLLGHGRIIIRSDPGAEQFYLRMGARRVGESASAVRPGRTLPLLHFNIE